MEDIACMNDVDCPERKFFSDNGSEFGRKASLGRRVSMATSVHRTVRIHCLFIKKDSNNGSDSSRNNANVYLGPGLLATPLLMEAARDVRKHISFDVVVRSYHTISLEDFADRVRVVLNIPTGAGIEIRACHEGSSDLSDTVTLTETSQLSEIFDSHTDEITVRVQQTAKSRFWPFATILISTADYCTTLLLAVSLLGRTSQTSKNFGWAVLASLILTSIFNLFSSFSLLRLGKATSKSCANWMRQCPASVALGCVLSMMNVLILELLWSNVMLLKFLNMFCPMPERVKEMTVYRSLYSLILGDIVPIVASVVDFTGEGDAGFLSVASLVTSAVSLLLGSTKKIIVALLIQDEVTSNTADGERTGIDPLLSPRFNNFDTMLGTTKKNVTIAVIHLKNIDTIWLKPKAIAAVVCRFHEHVFSVVRKKGGTVLRFTHGSVIFILNGPRSRVDHAAAAVEAACQIYSTWNTQRASALTQQGQHDIQSLELGCEVATASCYVGALGTSTRKEYQAIGTVWEVLSNLQGLRQALQIPMIANDECAVAADLPSYLRPCDCITGPSSSFTTYQILSQSSSIRKLRLQEPRLVQIWDIVFSELNRGSVEKAAIELNHYIDLLGDSVKDLVAEWLLERITGRDNIEIGQRYSRYPRTMFSHQLEEDDPKEASIEEHCARRKRLNSYLRSGSLTRRSCTPERDARHVLLPCNSVTSMRSDHSCDEDVLKIPSGIRLHAPPMNHDRSFQKSPSLLHVCAPPCSPTNLLSVKSEPLEREFRIHSHASNNSSGFDSLALEPISCVGNARSSLSTPPLMSLAASWEKTESHAL